MVAVAGLQRGELCRRVTGVVVTAFRQVEKAVPVRLVEVAVGTEILLELTRSVDRPFEDGKRSRESA